MLLRTLGLQQRAGFEPVIPLAGGFAQYLTGPVRVDADNALALPVANRCVQIISDSIARLPFGAYRGNLELDPTPTLLRNPQPGRTRIETISSMVMSLLLHGNAYAIVADRDYLGFPTALVPVNALSVSVQQAGNGEPVYRVAGVTYDPDDILHIRGMTRAGSLTGMGVIETCRRALGHSIAAEDYAGELWMTGAIPDGVLQTPMDLTTDEAEQFKAAFVAANGGRRRGPAVLSGGITYEQIAWSNVDLEFLESRKWNAVQVCQAFGVPTIFAMVPSGDSKTYQNVQQDSQAFVRYTLGPWLARVEEAFTLLLPRGQRARFNLDAMLRDETLDRYKAHQIGLAAGFLTVEEVRELEKLDPTITPAPVTSPTPPEDDNERPDTGRI